jgi:ABC-type nitrate/sulfonate/bicarbonate transport system substrate-binding protein
MTRSALRLAALFGAAALALAGCAGPETSASTDGPTELTTIRVQSQQALASEALYVGVDQGFFEDEGLKVEFVDVPDTSAAFAALQSGSLEFAFSPEIGTLQAVRQGLDLSMVAPVDGINPATETAAPDEVRKYTASGVYVSKESGITDLEGLAGATIAVPILKSQPDATITSVLLEGGIETDDIKWLTLDFVSAVAALKDGQVDAAFLTTPFTAEADAAGLLRIMNPSVEFFKKGGVTAWTASGAWVDNNPDTVAAFQRAVKTTADYANANLTEIKESVIIHAGMDLKPEDLSDSFWPTSVVPAEVQRIDDLLVESGFFDSGIDVAEHIAPQQ